MRPVILLVILLFTTNLFGQSNFDFVEVRITDGPGFYGTASIKLVREGLICRTYSAKSNRKGIRKNATTTSDSENEKIQFFPLKSLNQKKIWKLEKYINQNRIFDIKQTPYPTDSIYVVNNDTIKREFVPPFDDFPPTISFIQIRIRKYSYFKYKYCNPKVDTMLLLLNDLIPKKYRSIFQISPKCTN